MTKPSLSRLRELEAKATPGPWDANLRGLGPYGDEDGFEIQTGIESPAADYSVVVCPPARIKRNNAEIVVAARNSLPALIRVVEAARAVLETNDTLWAQNGTALLNHTGIGDELRAALSEIEP